jgi:predicted transcriptional regulator
MKHLVIVALTVFGLCAVAQPVALHAQAMKSTTKAMTAAGTVKSVSATSLTVTSGGKDMTFMLDSSTKFIGKGLGTKSQAKAGKMTATDAVAANDSVSVAYHDMSGMLHAASVRVTAKGTITGK